MKKEEILGKLARREPLFTSIPVPNKKRIMGVEVEYGMGFDFDESSGSKLEWAQAELDENSLRSLNRWFVNGGKIYVDGNHLESCTPETSNPLALVCAAKAMEELTFETGFFPELYANNQDSGGNTFGCHENYFCRLNPLALYNLVPFLIARTVIIGSGFFDLSDNSFKISQRAEKIQRVKSDQTTESRGIVGSRLNDHDIPAFNGWQRLHLILGDTNMCEVALFLKTGLTSLAIEMHEMRELPDVNFDENLCINDLHALSRRTSLWITQEKAGKIGDWTLASFRPLMSVTGYLWEFVEKAKELFWGRDSVTNTLLVIAEDTLGKLDRHPLDLVGRLDWITKFWLLKTLYEDSDKKIDPDIFHLNDVGYHNIDHENSLFYYLQKKNHIERLVSDSLILHAKEFAPHDTRAYIRGKWTRALKRNNLGNDVNWSTLPKDRESSINIPNPYDSYRHLLKEYRYLFA